MTVTTLLNQLCKASIYIQLRDSRKRNVCVHSQQRRYVLYLPTNAPVLSDHPKATTSFPETLTEIAYNSLSLQTPNKSTPTQIQRTRAFRIMGSPFSKPATKPSPNNTTPFKGPWNCCGVLPYPYGVCHPLPPSPVQL
jgi:hypothetical protein